MHNKSNEKINYEDEIKNLPHDEFKNYCLKLSKEIQEYCTNNNLKIDYVVPILRSGAVPAVYKKTLPKAKILFSTVCIRGKENIFY